MDWKPSFEAETGDGNNNGEGTYIFHCTEVNLVDKDKTNDEKERSRLSVFKYDVITYTDSLSNVDARST